MGIGNIGWTEFIVILAIALIFFGPRRLPGIAQAIGKSLREFQKALNEVKSEIAQAGREADARDELKRIAPRPAETIAPDEPEATKEAGTAGSRPPPESPTDPTPDKSEAKHGNP
ncbi:MAG: twin-arginine translocase subunit TatB [Gemmatimonadota bacterium]|nr:MAG: twin-arginine translocase subunit TatB [Gemmatimonadota bacterium]